MSTVLVHPADLTVCADSQNGQCRHHETAVVRDARDWVDAPTRGVQLRAVSTREFASAFSDARILSDAVRESCSEFSHTAGTHYVLSHDNRSGFAVRPDGELVYVFSLERGRGDALVSFAVKCGATSLDCFDGYLPTLYGRHGFKVWRREANWTPGGPDVVFMTRNCQPGWLSGL